MRDGDIVEVPTPTASCSCELSRCGDSAGAIHRDGQLSDAEAVELARLIALLPVAVAPAAILIYWGLIPSSGMSFSYEAYSAQHELLEFLRRAAVLAQPLRLHLVGDTGTFQHIVAGLVQLADDLRGRA